MTRERNNSSVVNSEGRVRDSYNWKLLYGVFRKPYEPRMITCALLAISGNACDACVRNLALQRSLQMPYRVVFILNQHLNHVVNL